MKVRNIIGNVYSGTMGKSMTAVDGKGPNYLREWVKPRDSRTPLQELCRDRMKQAVAVWRALSVDEKLEWEVKARMDGRRDGYRLFLSTWLLQHKQRPGIASMRPRYGLDKASMRPRSQS